MSGESLGTIPRIFRWSLFLEILVTLVHNSYSFARNQSLCLYFGCFQIKSRFFSWGIILVGIINSNNHKICKGKKNFREITWPFHLPFFFIDILMYRAVLSFRKIEQIAFTFSSSPPLHSPQFSLLWTPCINVVNLLQLMNQYWYFTINWSPYFILGFTLCYIVLCVLTNG